MKVTDKKCSVPAIDAIVDVSNRNQHVVSVAADQINVGVTGLVSQG